MKIMKRGGVKKIRKLKRCKLEKHKPDSKIGNYKFEESAAAV
jgi:hypothetical protein